MKNIAMALFTCLMPMTSFAAFSGADLFTGQTITVDPAKSEKGTVVIFVSAKCPCSASHENIIKNLVAEFPDFKFVAIHSNRDEKPDITTEHFKKSNLPLPLIQDDHAKLADQFKALKTPHVFVLNKAGTTVYSGGITNSHIADKSTRNYLKEVLTALHKGEKPPLSEERSMGCMISRRE